jgi:hypothetical protein
MHVEADTTVVRGVPNFHSEGAEFLVLGNLLIRGIHATKAYTRFPGWDVLAMNPKTGGTCRLQVKARLGTDYDGGFVIKNFEADFVVLVALNRGYRYRRKAREGSDLGDRPPEYFIFPMSTVKAACEGAPTWGRRARCTPAGQFPIYRSTATRGIS